jgi:hypothetical protein
MHQKGSFLLVSLLLSVFLTVWSLAAENLLRNAGFEEGKDYPEDWAPMWSRDKGAGTATADIADTFRGRRSLRISHNSRQDWCVSHGQRIEAAGLDMFEISGFAKCEDVNVNVGLSVVTRDKNNNVLDWIYGEAPTRGTHDWKKLDRRFVVPEDCATVEFRIIGVGPGTAWFDELSLVRRGNLRDTIGKSHRPDRVTFSNGLLRTTFDLESSAMEVHDSRTNHTWHQMASRRPIVFTSAKQLPAEDGYEFQAVSLPDAFLMEITVQISPQAPEIQMGIAASGEMGGLLAYPPPFVQEGDFYLAVPLNEGILFPVEDKTVRPLTLVGYSGHGICMAWYGLTDLKKGIMTIIETPDDMSIRMDRSDAGVLCVQPQWQPSLGKFAYTRRLRYWFSAEGGYVAQAKRYREYAKSIGRFKTLEQKRQENPNVDLLIGAVNVWTWQRDKLGVCRELKSLGVDRVLWSNGGSASQIEQINALGYLTSRYDIYQDVWPPGKPANANHEGWPEDLVLTPDGSWMRGWEIRRADGNYPGGVICSIPGLARAMRKIPQELREIDYKARFIDTTTASPWRECYNPRHPQTRTMDRLNKMRLLEFCSKDMNLVVGTETGIDPSVPYVHYYEGMLSLGPYRLPDAGRDMMKYKPPTEDFLKYQVGAYYRVPLWELVYHDCTVSTWYWGDYNNKAPEVWDRRDLFNILYGTPPMWMFDQETWRRQEDRFLQCYRNVCAVARKVGYAELVSHEFVTDDHLVQRTRFSNGTEIVLNFSEKAYLCPDGATVQPMAYVATDR